MQGVHKRIWNEVHQDQAITLEVVHRLVDNLERDYKDSGGNDKKEHIANQTVFILAAFLAALRGEEVFKLNLGETRKFFLEATRNVKHPHVVLPLRGRFKGEKGESYHFVAVTSKSNSVLQIGVWIERALSLKERRGIRHGLFFTDSRGGRMSSRDLEPGILERIIEVQRLHPELIRSEVDVCENYGISRSFRRGSNSEA